jgi:hypothetical protein
MGSHDGIFSGHMSCIVCADYDDDGGGGGGGRAGADSLS